jgi:hypothetical protein
MPELNHASIQEVKKSFLLLLLLPACVGGSLSNHEGIEEYPLRGANKDEAKSLKRCLLTAHEGMEKKIPRAKSKVDDNCEGYRLRHNRTNDGYEIMAQFHEDENTVRWTINQDGVIEEHLDPELDEDLEF